jgi:DNA-binding NarL/FixJ family response regulator
MAGLSEGESDTIDLLIVDDDPMVRTGLELILGGAGRIRVVGTASDGAQALAAAAALRPHVILMDIRMPVLDGLAATETLAAQANPPRVIVLTTFDADEMVVRALRVGAAGFLLKDTPPAQLVDAVERVAAGEPILSPSVTATLIARVAAAPGTTAADDERAEALATLDRLTDREREVALAIGRGLSNAEIGRELFLSLGTVKAHVGSLFVKLGADNRVQIAILVHQAGMLG